MKHNFLSRTAKFCLVTLILNIVAHVSLANPKADDADPNKEQEALKYLAELEGRYSAACNRHSMVSWDYVTNVTKAMEEISTAEATNFRKFQATVQKEILERFPNWRQLKNATILKEFKSLSIAGPGTMPQEEVAKMAKLKSEMEAEYSTALVCEYQNTSNCTLRLDPDLQSILKTEKDPKILAYYWTAWHDKISEKVTPEKYQQFLDFQSKEAKANGFTDMSDMWMATYDDQSPDYTSAGFKKQMLDLWGEIKPLYEKLHAYVRMKLRKQPEYKHVFGECGYIPAYLTGNMWGQDWTRLDSMTKPFPDAPSLDATEAMLKKNYTVLKMFQVSEKFFTDLGFPPMTSIFWEKSMLERPAGREVVCHASAHDMCLGKDNDDFRIKQCTQVSQDQLVTAHHEMGHIAYYQQYRDHDIVFREGANQGFHEAIGDALALAVVTPQHLQCKLELELGLDSSICTSPEQGSGTISETDLNYLYITALSKLVFFPFSISVDTWRWLAFEGKITPDQYTKKWWELRMKNQGLQPPTDRTSPNLFDPAAKYHIVADVEYLRYFVSYILQFQFYEAMCIAAGQYNPNDENTRPLYQCDFSGNKEAGQRLLNMMKLGASKPWPVALETLTKSKEMSITSMKNYFEPLMDHIDKELKKHGEIPGFGNCKDNGSSST